MNLAELPIREIDRFGEHVSVIFKERQWTNLEMRKTAMRLANGLKSIGINKGDRVIIQIPNCPEVYQSFQAVYMIGAVLVPINFMVGDVETAYIYQDTEAKAVISSKIFLPKIEACRKNAPDLRHIILIDPDVPEGTLSFHRLVEEHSDQIAIEPTHDDDLAALIYTAGTTGVPKGVMHTHYSLYINAEMQHKTVNLPPGMSSVNVLPLCHSYGIASLNYGLVVGGGKTVVLDKIDIDAIFSAIEQYRADIIGAVPTLYVYMLMHPNPEKYDLSSMKYWISGSAPLTLDTWQRFKEKFGGEIIEGWGLTEAGANNSANPFHGTKKIRSIGLPMQGTRMKVIDDQGTELPPGQQGEILISGPMLMKGYWRKPEETAKVLREGWLYTGDIGYRDEDGYYFITERKKDIIIKGGENIAPREVEEVLYSHASVAEAAVVGMPDEVYGEDIKAFIVLKPGKSATAEEIIAYCQGKLKRFKSPKEVIFIDALPKNLVGKILRKELRKM
ncbi:MAG: long-chain fatty acid--CoA ligase [Desulfobacteraceae bacterium]|nr:MAG: long-chain fatty acid--CoA ligase [Desulfobacteraceae bacterium]